MDKTNTDSNKPPLGCAAGCGKTSLLRTLRGLWCTIDRSDSGASLYQPDAELSQGQQRVAGSAQWQLACVPLLHADSDGGGESGGGSGGTTAARCMFLPQAVYMLPRATLREQLAYPLKGSGVAAVRSDDTILSLLEELQMPVSQMMSRIGGLDICHSNWPSLLPPGQRQALSAARACLHAPSLAVLDEATSMVSGQTEQAIYQALRAREIAVLSVGHRESLRPLHDEVIIMQQLG